MKKSFSGLALVTFCATLSMIAGLSLAIIFACATAAFAGAGSSEDMDRAAATPTSGASAATEADLPADKTFSGVVTDDHCGPRHAINSDMSSAECTRMCVRNGSPYTLVDGDKKYALDGNVDELNRVAGQRTRISGTLDGMTIRVISVASEPEPQTDAAILRPQ